MHFPHDERLRLGRIYQFVINLGAENTDEYASLSRVSLLGRPLKLTEQAVYETALGLQDAKRRNDLVALGSGQLLRDIATIHMLPSDAKWAASMAKIKAEAARCSEAATEGR